MEHDRGISARLVRLGTVRAAVLITTASVLASVAICVAIYLLTGTIHQPRWDMFVLPIVVPVIVAPLVSTGVMRALVRVEALQRALAGEVAERRAAERELDRLAHHDPLTALVNRRGLARDGQRLVAQARAEDSGLVVVALDLDGLKALNDARGHDVGDQAIVDAADALRAAAPGGLVGRLGGDEFIVVVPASGATAAVAEHLRAAIADAGLTAGAGATALRDGEDVETAWSRADRLLLEAKRAGRDRVRVA